LHRVSKNTLELKNSSRHCVIAGPSQNGYLILDDKYTGNGGSGAANRKISNVREAATLQ